MEQPPSTDGHGLSYARVGTDQPPKTRVEVKDIRDGVRFIDPPLATSNLGRRILIRLASQVVALELCLVLFCVVWRLTRLEAIALMSAAGLIKFPRSSEQRMFLGRPCGKPSDANTTI